MPRARSHSAPWLSFPCCAMHLTLAAAVAIWRQKIRMKPAVSDKPAAGYPGRYHSRKWLRLESHDDTVHPRSRPRYRRHRCARRARQRPRCCGSCRSLGLSPHLGGGASQHAGHRQRRDVGRDRSYRSRHQNHPRRRGRYHASQPCTLRHRRAVRDARAAVSRPHRPWTWPRARHRPAHVARFAPHA